MPDEWDITDDEIDSWLEEWEAVDRAARTTSLSESPEFETSLPTTMPAGWTRWPSV